MLDSRVYRILGWIAAALTAIGLGIQAVREDWIGTILMAVFLASTVFFLLWRNRLPSLFSFLFAVAAMLNAYGWVFDFWHRIAHYDDFTHAFTTFSASLAVGFVVFYSSRLHFKQHGVVFAVTIAAFGIALGGLWEIFEWSVGVQESQQNIAVDLIADSIGGLAAGILAAWARTAELPSTEPIPKERVNHVF